MPRPPRRRTALLAAALATSSACSIPLGAEGPRVSVSLYLLRAAQAAPPASRAALFQTEIGGRRVEVAAAPPAADPRAEREARGPRYGDVPVRVALLSAAGDTLAAASFTQRFERDHGHWVAALVGPERPVGHCIGTLVVVPFRAAGRDTLFLMHGRLPDGAIC